MFKLFPRQFAYANWSRLDRTLEHGRHINTVRTANSSDRTVIGIERRGPRPHDK